MKNSKKADLGKTSPFSMKLSEKDRNAALAVLALAAIFVAGYVLFFFESDPRSADGSEFYALLTKSEKVGFIYDVRGAEPLQASAIYQCGVDMIYAGRFAGREITNIACDEEGCLSSASGSTKISFDQAKRQLSGSPYIQVKPGEPGYAFFQKHMEIYIGKNVTGNTTCDIAATEET